MYSLTTYRDRPVKLVCCSFAACSCSTDYVDVFSLSPPRRRRGRAAAPDSQSVDHPATASAPEVLESREDPDSLLPNLLISVSGRNVCDR